VDQTPRFGPRSGPSLDVATAPPTERTPEQLAAAAFVELVLRIDKVAHEPPI